MSEDAGGLEIERLRARLAEAEEALQAIYHGTVDALVVRSPTGPQIYTLVGAQEPYRQFVEQMNEGALTLSENQQILYSNRHFADLLGYPLAQLVGKPLADFVAVADAASLADLLDDGANRPVRRELLLRRRDGSLTPVMVAVSSLSFDESPTIITRLIDDSGWMMTGGVPTLGRVSARPMRSMTTCRAFRSGVPGWKIKSIDDSESGTMYCG